MCVVEALKRAQVDSIEIGHVVFGNVIITESKHIYLGRVTAKEAGVPKEVPALTVNRPCGSGVQAIVSAAQAIMLASGLAGNTSTASTRTLKDALSQEAQGSLR